MYTEIDEKVGFVKVFWKDIRERVNKVEPTFTKIVDSLNPDRTFPIYLAYLPFGDYKGDTESIFIPNMNGSYCRLSDSEVPKDVLKQLGYGKDTSPVGMVLEKELECFIHLEAEGVTIPWVVYRPGRFFSFGKHLDKENTRPYIPNGILSVISGARSMFMLPSIGCATNHINLQRDFNIKSPPPKSLYDHWKVFKEIYDSKVIENRWCSCLIYFSEKWMSKIHNDIAWLPLKAYFYELAWGYFAYDRASMYDDIIYCSIQKSKNLKPNPYLTDTAKHLFAVAMGNIPGYSPALDEEIGPIALLQKVFVDSYGMKKYLPTIIRPSHFSDENKKFPIYYSLQTLSSFIFSPKSRNATSMQFEMRELQYLMDSFVKELSGNNSICRGTVLNEVARFTDFTYYHNKQDCHKVISHSSLIPKNDGRFNKKKHYHSDKNAKFAADAPFLRGCIKITTNE